MMVGAGGLHKQAASPHPLLAPSAAVRIVCLSRSSRGVSAFRLLSGKKKADGGRNLHNGCSGRRRRAKANTARRDSFSSQVIGDKRNTTTKGSACTTACTWDQLPSMHMTLWRGAASERQLVTSACLGNEQ